MVVKIWTSTGGATGRLGLPTSNVGFTSVGFFQQFQHGYVIQNVQAGPPQITYVADPKAALPHRSLRSHILRQVDATAWFVDAAGRRHWIPNGGVYACVGGDSVLIPGNVAGYAIATLPDGGPTYCGEDATGQELKKPAKG